MRAELKQVTTAPQIDLDEAREFLKLIGAQHCTFQTFDDNPDRALTKRSLAKVFHGGLDEHADELAALNRRGAGVFVTLNQTDQQGRKAKNIKRVRAASLDLDGGSLAPVMEGNLPPQVVVESSPGRYHAYWLVEDLPLEMFAAVQRSIAKCFDGDPAVAKLTHVARLPGFNHCKGEPFRTRIIADNDLPRYTAAEILKEFPPEAKAHKPSGSLKGGRVVPADEPLRCAYSFLESEFMTADGVLTLQFYRGSYYRWQGTHFAEVDEKDVRAALYAFLDEAITPRAGGFEPFKPTKAKVNAILDALQSGVLQSRDKVVPFWLEPVQSRSVDGLIACGNGLLDLHSRTLRAHSPYLFNINCLPFDYDPAAAEPERWLQFLDDLWPDDEEARRTLQEIFGLLLTPETKHHKIFMLVGPKRSGKGTIARVLTGLLGKDNVVSPTLAGLSSHFGLAPLIDKRAAIISDARLGPQTNAHTVAERLLAISGDDPLTIDRKYRDAWTGHVGVRFLILTNELPRLTDASGALASRFVLLTMRRSFYGKENLDLTTALLEELPGIMNWALRGLDRLNKRGRFEVPPSSLQAIRQLEDLASPVGAFIRDWCAVGTDNTVGVKQLYAAYSNWCEQEGHRPVNNSVFGRDLRAALPEVLTRGRGADRYYQGLGLSAFGKQEYMGLEGRRR